MESDVRQDTHDLCRLSGYQIYWPVTFPSASEKNASFRNRIMIDHLPVTSIAMQVVYHLDNWHNSSTFPFILDGKKLYRIRSLILRGVHATAFSVSLFRFWSLANQFPDLVN